MSPDYDLTLLAIDDVSRRALKRDRPHAPQKLTEPAPFISAHPRKVLSVIDQRFLLNQLKAGVEQKWIAVELVQRRYDRLSSAERNDPARVAETELSAQWLSKYIAKLNVRE